MGNIMYFSFGMKKGYVRWFWVYRILSFYPYMIVITILAVRTEIDAPDVPDPFERRDITLRTKTGLSILIYTWIAGFTWPYVVCLLANRAISMYALIPMLEVNLLIDNSTSRDLIGLIYNKQYKEVQQLLRFGYIVKKDYRVQGVKYFCVYI